MNEQTPDEFDQTLAKSLQTRWPERARDERQMQTILTQLKNQHRKIIMQTRVSNILRPVAFVGGLAALVLALSWLLGSMRPNPAAEITYTPTVYSTEDANNLPAETPDPNATPTPTPAGEATPGPLLTPTVSSPGENQPANGFISMPNVTFSFANPLPDSPEQVSLYQQKPEGELNEDAVRQMAQQMGVDGEVTSYLGEGGDTVYEVNDGNIRMIFYGFPDQFSYFIVPPATPSLAEPLPFEQRIAIAEEFLNAHGLLNFPYRAEPSETDPNGVRFVELLDGIPLVYGIGKNPGMIERINISITPDREISSLFHSHHNYQDLDSSPILSAQEAWARLAQPNAKNRIQYAVLAAPMSWARAGAEPTEVLTGYLNNENGATTFYADDGRTLTLLDIPADMPLYPTLEIRGTVTDTDIDWSSLILIDYGYGVTLTCGGGGGGGSSIPDANFGGGSFATLMVDSSIPSTPTEFISPIQPGDAVEGVEGQLTVYLHVALDGSETYRYTFWFPGDEINPGWFGSLTGNMVGAENLQYLPIKIWGTVAGLDEQGQPIIAVDRHEEAYPGMRIQAWLGTQQIVTLEGQEVVLLTAQDGNQYATKSSIDDVDDDLIGVSGDAVIIEGYVIPDQTFGGYPILYELVGMMAEGRTDLNGYELQSNRPHIMDETLSSDPATTIAGHITIEKVELMYSAATLTTCTPEFVNNPENTHFLYAQPIWRFTGHFDDGRIFEIQIQALTDEYLR